MTIKYSPILDSYFITKYFGLKPGRNASGYRDSVEHWIQELLEDIDCYDHEISLETYLGWWFANELLKCYRK